VSAFRDMHQVSLDPPPRRVTRRAAFRILFGSLPSRIGWAVLVFGLTMLRAELVKQREEAWFRGALETRVGHVTSIHELRSRRSRTPSGDYVVRFRFAPRPGAAETSSGRSYTRDRDAIPEIGSEVSIEVPAAHPEIGRLASLSLYTSQSFPAVMLLPILGALGALGFGVFRGRRQLRLLVDSRLTSATLDRHDEPGFFERRRGHLLYFVYDDHRRVARSVVVQTRLPGRFKQGPLVVAHDDSDPPRAMLLQALPGQPRLDDDQVFRDGTDALDVLLSLLLPAAGLLGALATTVAVLNVLF
jgi:hypothetical protein